MRGPIDFIIVGFDGNKFDGSILRALGGAIDRGIIKLLALSLIRKDEKGVVSVVDLDNLDDKYIMKFVKKYPTKSKLIDKDDFDETAALLNNDTSAGLLIIEHVWAVPLKKALVKAKGVLISDGRIHPDAAYLLTKK